MRRHPAGKAFAVPSDAAGIRFTCKDYVLAVAADGLAVVGFGEAGNDWVKPWVHINFVDESGRSGEAR